MKKKICHIEMDTEKMLKMGEREFRTEVMRIMEFLAHNYVTSLKELWEIVEKRKSGTERQIIRDMDDLDAGKLVPLTPENFGPIFLEGI